MNIVRLLAPGFCIGHSLRSTLMDILEFAELSFSWLSPKPGLTSVSCLNGVARVAQLALVAIAILVTTLIEL